MTQTTTVVETMMTMTHVLMNDEGDNSGDDCVPLILSLDEVMKLVAYWMRK